MHAKRDYKAFDYSLAAVTILLALFGIIAIGSATGFGDGEMSTTFKMQIVWAVSGVLIMLAAAFVDYRFICKFYIPIYGVCIGLLILVLLIGSKEGDAARWLRFGPPERQFGIQPSEFAKIFMLIFLATFIDKYRENINKLSVLSAITALGLLPAGLTLIQPSLSASLLIAILVVVMLFMGKTKYRYFVIAALIIVPTLLFLYYDLNREQHIIIDKIFQGYQLNKRLKSFFGIGVVNENYVFQTNQSIRALGSGMLTGKGLYNNVVTVPASHNDFIFSIIGAEFGFAGCIAVLGAIFFIVAKCFLIAERADSFCGRLLASGAGALVGCQTFVHVGVNTGILPNTGIPLPFISAGGSSLWISLVAVGLALNVGMTKTKLMFTD